MTELGKLLREDGGIDKAKEIAKEMIRNNEPIDKTVKYTKLSNEEVLDLIKEINKN